MHEHIIDANAELRSRLDELREQRKHIVLRPRYWLYYMLVFASGARRQIFIVFAAFLMVEKFGFSAGTIALRFLVNRAVTVGLAPLVGRMVGRWGERSALTLEYSGLVLIFVAYAFVDSAAFAVGLYVLDHIFFAMAIAMKTYFQKIADPADIAPVPPSNANSSRTTSTPATDPTSPPVDPKAAYRKALELGPRIELLTSEAAADLQQQAWSEALPKQEEVLKLLKEIAALLPPQEQQDEDQENEDQEEQEPENQDEQQEENGQQEKPSDDEQKKKQDQDKADPKKRDDAEKQQSDKEKAEKKQGQPPEKMTRQQAESLLRQVRERERQHRQIEKELRRLLQSRVFVEKDW